MLDIPAAVGGRFSVLTPVGVLPAALVGIEHGAATRRRARHRAAMPERRSRGESGRRVRVAAVSRRHEARRHIQVLMPYSDALRDIADWFVQLWAESLGKHRSPATKASGRRRSVRSERPTSTARSSCSWKVRRTKRSPSSR